jgi:hypothetical protein
VLHNSAKIKGKPACLCWVVLELKSGSPEKLLCTEITISRRIFLLVSLLRSTSHLYETKGNFMIGPDLLDKLLREIFFVILATLFEVILAGQN